MTFSDMEDLITISFPVYNVASTIERSLMSALNQTYSNIEYLIYLLKSNEPVVYENVDAKQLVYKSHEEL